MAGTFDARIEELMAAIGGGELTGTTVVDQVYALYQHEDLALHHPRGGGAKYLITPLMEMSEELFMGIAHDFLEDGGKKAMIAGMESLCQAIKITAPVEFNNLRRSGHPIVFDDGAVIYDRPPEQHRLTEAEIEALKDAHPSGWITKNGLHIFIGVKEGS